MSGSLTVLKINHCREIFKQRTSFTLKENNNLNDYDGGSQEIGFPLTEITFKQKDPEYYYFDVKFSTDTKTNPIYIYGEGLEEYYKGYQEIEFFKLLLDSNFTYTYIFTSKRLAGPFQKRLEKMNYLSGENVHFDFARLKEMPNFMSGYGLWKNSDGIVKKAGEFGHGIENTIDDFSVITTFYIDYMYGDRKVQLILSKDGRISTNTSLENNDLLVIFNEIKSTLIVN